ncbi:hypothetical protein LAUMK7_05725 [Mycobacterium kansasii]|nr:hypothetical protein LAUMK7_05725 [Mycobacterium kansasii]VAZ81208.1 hypothetical protein LAUMK15_05753 [Mycobacterium persicum]
MQIYDRLNFSKDLKYAVIVMTRQLYPASHMASYAPKDNWCG